MPARCQHGQFLARRSRVQEVVDSTVPSLVPVLPEPFRCDPRVAELSRNIMEDPFTSPGGLWRDRCGRAGPLGGTSRRSEFCPEPETPTEN